MAKSKYHSDLMAYTTHQLAVFYNVTKETVRNWTTEFGEYLSPLTRPGKNKSRQYTTQDAEVMSLVAEMKQRGLSYADIHASLRSGARGRAPDVPPEELQLIATSDTADQLALQVQQLQHALAATRAQLEQAQRDAASVSALREEKTRLETALEYTKAELSTSQEQLQEARAKIEQLSRQLGEEYARGVLETLERRGDLPKKGTQ
jgi:DNA-binding transcriptional MerR regulator